MDSQSAAATSGFFQWDGYFARASILMKLLLRGLQYKMPFAVVKEMKKCRIFCFLM
jgi:hypothetical protein